MRDIFELAPHVLPWAPTIPEPTMIQYLREAAITFCQRSRSWRSESTYILNHADEDVPLITCCDSVIFEIESARYRAEDDTEWQEKLRTVQFDQIEGWERNGVPRFYTQKITDTLRVVPFQPGEVKVVMYLKPDQQAQSLPDYLFEQHQSTIAAGALAKILLLPGYDFNEPSLAMMYAQQFSDACDHHFRDNLRGQQRAKIRTRPNNF